MVHGWAPEYVHFQGIGIWWLVSYHSHNLNTHVSCSCFLWGCPAAMLIFFFPNFPAGQAACAVAWWGPSIDGAPGAMCQEAWTVQVSKGWNWFCSLGQMKMGGNRLLGGKISIILCFNSCSAEFVAAGCFHIWRFVYVFAICRNPVFIFHACCIAK